MPAATALTISARSCCCRDLRRARRSMVEVGRVDVGVYELLPVVDPTCAEPVVGGDPVEGLPPVGGGVYEPPPPPGDGGGDGGGVGGGA